MTRAQAVIPKTRVANFVIAATLAVATCYNGGAAFAQQAPRLVGSCDRHQRMERLSSPRTGLCPSCNGCDARVIALIPWVPTPNTFTTLDAGA